MRKSRFTESQIVALLRKGESGVANPGVHPEGGDQRATYSLWRQKYGWPSPSLPIGVRHGPPDGLV